MKRILSLFMVNVLVILLFTGCNESNKEIELLHDNFNGLNYEEAYSQLEADGFTNIKIEALNDLTSDQKDLDMTVQSVIIDGDYDYTVGASYASDSEITILYHNIKMVYAPFSANKRPKKDLFDAIESSFIDAGFINVKCEPIEDLIFGWFTEDGEVEEVLIDGDGEFMSSTEYPFDTIVVIRYHTFPIPKVTGLVLDEQEITFTSIDAEPYSGEVAIDGNADFDPEMFIAVSDDDNIAEIALSSDDENLYFKIVPKAIGKTKVWVKTADDSVISEPMSVSVVCISNITIDSEEITFKLSEDDTYIGKFDTDMKGNTDSELFSAISENVSVATIKITTNSAFLITPVGVGETYVYIKTNDNAVLSEKIKVIVTEVEEEESSSEEIEEEYRGPIVYTTPYGEKYHYSKACAGKNAIEQHLYDVQDYYDPCKKCA